MTRVPSSARGFSLVELMVVVAIISVLASIAIPNFERFTGKARQAEAKTALGSIYMAEKTAQADLQSYTNCLWQAGYQPSIDSFRLYTTGAYGGGTSSTWISSDPSGTCDYAGDIPWSNANVRNDATFWGSQPGTPAPVAQASWGASSSTTFTMVAFGTILPGRPLDLWSIDQDNNLTNLQSGL